MTIKNVSFVAGMVAETGLNVTISHIFGGSRRKLSEKYGLTVYLCGERCHRLGRLSVHQNAEVADFVHKYGQRKAMYEQKWTVEQFMEVLGANYLDQEEINNE